MKFEGTKGESCKCFGRKPLVPFLRNSGKSWLVMNYGNHPKERNLRPFLPVFSSVSLQKNGLLISAKRELQPFLKTTPVVWGGAAPWFDAKVADPVNRTVFMAKSGGKTTLLFSEIPTSKNPHGRRRKFIYTYLCTSLFSYWFIHVVFYLSIYLFIYAFTSIIIIKTYVFMYIKKQKPPTQKQSSLKSSHAALE